MQYKSKKKFLFDIVVYGLLILFPIGISFVYKFPFLNNINRFVGFLIIIIFLLFQTRKIQKVTPEVVLYSLFVIWALSTGILISSNINNFLNQAQFMSQLMLLVIAVAGLSYIYKSADIPFLAVIIMNLIIVGFAIAEGNYSLTSTVVLSQQQTSFLKNPNDFGYYSLLAIVGLTYFWGKTNKQKIKILLTIPAVLFAIAIVLSGSRKAFLGLLFYLLTWLFFCYRIYIFKRISTILLVLAILIGSYFLVEYTWRSTRLGARLGQMLETETFLGDKRTGMYEEGIQFFLDNPIFGIGLNNYRNYSRYSAYSHSDYIEVLSTTGIVGFLLYFSIYLVLWKRLHFIQKLKNEIQTYHAGVFKALSLTLLVLAIGRINSQSLITMYMLAGVFGYSYFIETTIKKNAIHLVNRPQI